MSNTQQPGWYPDPWGQAGQRWWDGQQWSSNVSGAPASGGAAAPAGVAAPGAPASGGAVQTSPAPPGPWATGTGGPWPAATGPAGFAPPGASAKPGPPASPVVKAIAPIGAVLAAIGSVLEWASVDTGFTTVTKNGLDADGALTLPASLIFGGLALSALIKVWSMGRMIGALVLAALVALIAVVDIADVSSRFSDLEAQGFEVDASVGIGLWLVLVGAIVGVAGCVIALASPKSAAGTR